MISKEGQNFGTTIVSQRDIGIVTRDHHQSTAEGRKPIWAEFQALIRKGSKVRFSDRLLKNSVKSPYTSYFDAEKSKMILL